MALFMVSITISVIRNCIILALVLYSLGGVNQVFYLVPMSKNVIFGATESLRSVSLISEH